MMVVARSTLCFQSSLRTRAKAPSTVSEHSQAENTHISTDIKTSELSVSKNSSPAAAQSQTSV